MPRTIRPNGSLAAGFTLIAILLTGAASPASAQQQLPDFTKFPLAGPSSYCANSGVKKGIIDDMNDRSSGEYLAGAGVFDLSNMTTLSVNRDGSLFSCHGLFKLTTGQTVLGIYRMTRNSVGETFSIFKADK